MINQINSTYKPIHRHRRLKATVSNKLVALILIAIGIISFYASEGDATALFFFSIIGIGLFFSKERWIR